MVDLFTNKCTVYNVVPTSTNPEYGAKRIIDKCFIGTQMHTKSENLGVSLINRSTVRTKDFEHYKKPDEFYAMSKDERTNYYTFANGDFIVFGEVSDVIATSTEYNKLKVKYASQGFEIKTEKDNRIIGNETDHLLASNI